MLCCNNQISCLKPNKIKTNRKKKQKTHQSKDLANTLWNQLENHVIRKTINDALQLKSLCNHVGQYCSLCCCVIRQKVRGDPLRPQFLYAEMTFVPLRDQVETLLFVSCNPRSFSLPVHRLKMQAVAIMCVWLLWSPRCKTVSVWSTDKTFNVVYMWQKQYFPYSCYTNKNGQQIASTFVCNVTKICLHISKVQGVCITFPFRLIHAQHSQFIQSSHNSSHLNG